MEHPESKSSCARTCGSYPCRFTESSLKVYTTKGEAPRGTLFCEGYHLGRSRVLQVEAYVSLTEAEIDVGLELADITIDQVKTEFKVLFPEAAANLQEGSQTEEACLFLGFKAGMMVGADLKKEE